MNEPLIKPKNADPSGTDRRKTVVYCRESRDENGENYRAILTQREILLEFCRRRGLINIVEIILDDDVSGTCFQRLGHVTDLVRRKEAEVIVFKDASRLGRNLRDSLNFIHELETAGAEILFESEKYDEDIFPLLAWFNERRAKEDSLKIRRVLRHKMERGELLTKTLYGYRRQAGALVPDPDTGDVVRGIFKLFLQGHSTGDIAYILNARGVPTPSSGSKIAAPAWNRQHVWRILCNDSYLGVMTYGKRSAQSYKDKRIVNRPPEEWVVIENHHAPLVSKEDFAAVQAIRVRTAHKNACKRDRPFSGLLQCGRCGGSLVVRSGAGRQTVYVCGKYHREGAAKDPVRGNYGCGSHKLREDALYEVIIGYIKRLLAENPEETERAIGEALQSDETEKRALQLRDIVRRCSGKIERIYEDRLNGVISEELFIKKYREHEKALESAERELSELTAETGGLLPDITRQTLEAAVSRQNVTRVRLRELFAGIIVFEPGEITKEDGRRLGLSGEDCGRVFRQGGWILLENLSDPAR